MPATKVGFPSLGILRGILPNLNSNLNQGLNMNLNQHDKSNSLKARTPKMGSLKFKLFSAGMKSKLPKLKTKAGKL